MNQLQEEIYKTVDIIVQNRLKDLKSDRTKKGKVISVDSKECIVQIDGEEYDCKIRRGLNIKMDDIVFVKFPQNNDSFKYVDSILGSNKDIDDEEIEFDYGDTPPAMNMKITKPKITVMDDTYWNIETIRTGTNLGDLSISTRSFESAGVPDSFYNIYVENGIVKTAIKEYSDYLKMGWDYQFSLGEGTAVSIAFDGHWELYKSEEQDRWGLITEKNPYLFWVDNNKKLYVQLWDNENSKLELATNVVKIKAQRGWKSISTLVDDQGIVALYIKTDGKVYYRNYCYLTSIEGYAWDIEREITEFAGIANNINMFMTNDYRLGIVIEDNQGKIHWLITERNWAGMAIAPESITVAPVEVSVDFVALDYIKAYAGSEYISVAPSEILVDLLYAGTDNKIISVLNVPTTMIDENNEEYEDWGQVIEFVIQHPIPNLTLQNIELIDLDANSPILITDIEMIDIEKYRISLNDINNTTGDISMTIINAKNPSGDNYNSFTKTFTPINLEPTFIPLPEVEVIWNE